MRILLGILVPAVLLIAQSPLSDLRLQIQDSSGAPIAADIRLSPQPAGPERHLGAPASGLATLPALPPGPYRLTVSRSGFTPYIADLTLPAELLHITLAPASPAFHVQVVDTTPLPGIPRDLNQIPAPVQTATADDLSRTNSLHLADLLARRLAAVNINEVQGNPFQPDVNYRGFSASPLLGTPQGLSLYMDGVRLNQPFGDVVSWVLLPRAAIAEATLVPGSNPLFGLNTLGGALALTTKSGLSHPETTLQLAGGNFGRRMADLTHGASHRSGLHWFLASSLFFEDGWRTNSPSNIRQFFGKLGYSRPRTQLAASLSFANNQLNGNGLQEYRLLQRDYTSVYTMPDITANRSPFLNLTARHNFSAAHSVSANAYYRSIRTRTFNGDINEESLDQSLYQPSAAERAALTAAGYTGFPLSGATAANTPFPSWRCIAQALLVDEPSEKCNGLINLSRTEQHHAGFSGQWNWTPSTRHQLTAGTAYDRAGVNFTQSSELGYLNPDRSVTGVGAFGDGVTGGDADGEPYDTRVNLRGTQHTFSLFATDTIALSSRLHLTLSGRYNRTVIDNRDRINPGGGPGSLDGHHTFDRFNPAAGLTYSLSPLANLYVSYSEANRAPTSIELGCADPASPCKLPNAMAGDPPLRQIKTRTVEAGLRGALETRLRWNLGWFFTENRDDILFVASPQTGYGYFRNFGKTRRQGLEAAAHAHLGRFDLGANYTLLDATYRTAESVGGAGNSTNDLAQDGEPGMEGLIAIRPGNHLPLLPRHIGKAYLDTALTTRFHIDLSLNAQSSAFARGNENNLHQADGTYYLGPGRSPGFAVVHLAARFQLHRRVELFAQINNLFDRHYFTAAQLGPAGFTPTGAFQSRNLPAIDGEYPVQQSTLFAPGAPRTVYGGVRVRF